MAKTRYYYNSQTCQYEVYKTTTADRLLNIASIFMIVVLVGAGFGWMFKNVFEQGELETLRRENKELTLHFELLDKRVGESEEMLAALRERDDNIYRVIFEADPVSESIRKAGVGGTDRYKDLIGKGIRQESMLVNLSKKIDDVHKHMYVQTKSYDEIIDMVQEKQKMLSSIPAVMPVSLNSCRIASGFGRRIDPVYKTPKFHAGMDFSARTGTKIYSTGVGKVVKAGNNKGYGQCVIIDHGFGYQTLYGHMSKIKVKVGQTVKRGDILGLVGSTGKSTGPHLHYEVIYNNKKVNPVNYYYNDLNAEQYHDMLELASESNQSFD